MPPEPLDQNTIDRAIYLDFEGRGPRTPRAPSPRPTLAGTVVDGVYKLYVFERALFEAGSQRGGRGVGLDQFLEELLGKARAESRRIVHFSSREPEVFQELELSLEGTGLDAKDWAKSLCRETIRACKTADRTFRSRDSSANKKKLAKTKAFGMAAHCAAFLGMPAPSSYGYGLVGKWIRYVQKQADTKPLYSQWSQGAKSKWTKLIKHNEHDCRAMQHILNASMM